MFMVSSSLGSGSQAPRLGLTQLHTSWPVSLPSLKPKWVNIGTILHLYVMQSQQMESLWRRLRQAPTSRSCASLQPFWRLNVRELYRKKVIVLWCPCIDGFLEPLHRVDRKKLSNKWPAIPFFWCAVTALFAEFCHSCNWIWHGSMFYQ